MGKKPPPKVDYPVTDGTLKLWELYKRFYRFYRGAGLTPIHAWWVGTVDFIDCVSGD